jgi:hypothetical protein
MRIVLGASSSHFCKLVVGELRVTRGTEISHRLRSRHVLRVFEKFANFCNGFLKQCSHTMRVPHIVQFVHVPTSGDVRSESSC